MIVSGRPSGPTHQGGRKPLGIDVNPVLLLPAGDLQALAEIPLAVHQADGHQRQRSIRGLLQHVARQHAEPARVDRQRLVYAVLGAQERDRPLRRHRSRRRTRQVRCEGVLERRHAGEQSAITGRPRKRLTRRLLQQANRILAAQLPATLVDTSETRPCRPGTSTSDSCKRCGPAARARPGAVPRGRRP